MRKELEKILEDPELVEKVMFKQTQEEAKKAIEKNGVSVTEEEMKEIHDLYSDIYKKCKKIKEEELSDVSGGLFDFFKKKDFTESLTGGHLNNKEAGLVGASVLFSSIFGLYSRRRMKQRVEKEAQENAEKQQKMIDEMNQKMASLEEKYKEKVRELNEQDREFNGNAIMTAFSMLITYLLKDDIKSLWID